MIRKEKNVYLEGTLIWTQGNEWITLCYLEATYLRYFES